MTKIILSIGLLTISACSSAETDKSNQQADLNEKIMINAKVWTGNEDQPWAETVVMKDDRIKEGGRHNCPECVS